MSEPLSGTPPPTSDTPDPEPVEDTTALSERDMGLAEESTGINRRLLVWGGLSLAWLAYLGLGQVNARFWVLGDFKTDWKPMRSIWRIQVGSLPGGDNAWMVQALVLMAMALFVIGVIAGMYVLLVPSSGWSDDAGDS